MIKAIPLVSGKRIYFRFTAGRPEVLNHPNILGVFSQYLLLHIEYVTVNTNKTFKLTLKMSFLPHLNGHQTKTCKSKSNLILYFLL